MKQREQFSSRLGFLLISAGCAIGLGNVWRFPYITGQYGGGAFVLLYLVFLALLSLPILVMELAVGRASRKSVARSFAVLQPRGGGWHWFGYFAMAGNYLLMMFYTTVSGWMLCYVVRMLRGDFADLSAAGVEESFARLQGQPGPMLFWMLLTVALGFLVCALGLQNGVERITKMMMSCLFLFLLLLCVRAVTLPGAAAGLRFYLVPDFSRMQEQGLGECVYAAMSQAFFSLSVGVGSMAIFGSYTSRERSLTGEAVRIAALDTTVALLAGLMVLPACFAFGVDPQQGPGLVFVTLPSMFNQMAGGRWWGALFFLFLSFAALSTVIAVFENILSFGMDLWGWSRRKAVWINGILVSLLSIPCVLGFNVWSGFQIPGIGNIQAVEDFLVSYNFLPLGSLVYLLFCVGRRGWGWDAFLAEANTGRGLKFPRAARGYLRYVLPLAVALIFAAGYVPLLRRWFFSG